MRGPMIKKLSLMLKAKRVEGKILYVICQKGGFALRRFFFGIIMRLFIHNFLILKWQYEMGKILRKFEEIDSQSDANHSKEKCSFLQFFLISLSFFFIMLQIHKISWSFGYRSTRKASIFGNSLRIQYSITFLFYVKFLNDSIDGWKAQMHTFVTYKIIASIIRHQQHKKFITWILFDTTTLFFLRFLEIQSHEIAILGFNVSVISFDLFLVIESEFFIEFHARVIIDLDMKINILNSFILSGFLEDFFKHFWTNMISSVWL